MSGEAPYRSRAGSGLRVLFCFGVQAPFFEEATSTLVERVAAIEQAFADLSGRFGVRVLGTLDDDELAVGPSSGFPWTAYILAEAPSLDAVTAICDLVRTTDIGDGRLWRYLKVEARVGRPLFFGNA